MRTVVITGAAGVVGRALSSRLRETFDVIGVDKGDFDILAHPGQLADALRGADVVIHLAFDRGGIGEPREDWRSPHRNPVNSALFDEVLRQALLAGVRLFLHASSIHVEDTLGYSRRPGQLLTAQPGVFRAEAASGYGQSKREQEAALQTVADRFPHGAVSLRLGAVTADDQPMRHHHDREILAHERRVWLSHRDLADLVTSIIRGRSEPGFDVVYAVSDNDGRFHDVSNSYGW